MHLSVLNSKSVRVALERWGLRASEGNIRHVRQAPNGDGRQCDGETASGCGESAHR